MKKYRSVFISDTHLGTKNCKDKKLLEFLKSFSAENLFLVGDIIDGWSLKQKHYWTTEQTEILRRILKLSEKMQVVYVVGNHDDFIRPFFKFDFQFGTLKIVDDYQYLDLSGRKIYITHGDRFDFTMKIPKWIISAPDFLLDRLGKPSANDKIVKWVVDRIGTRKRAECFAENYKYDSCIIGHTHLPEISPQYMNCGDWVSNNSYLVETLNGKWELKYWS